MFRLWHLAPVFCSNFLCVPQCNLDVSALPVVLPVTPLLFSALAAFLHSAGLAGQHGGKALGI